MHHYPIATMISDFYKADMPRMSERNNRRRPRASNVSPVPEFVGDIDDKNTATDVSTITRTPASTLVTKAAMTPTTRSTTI